MPVYRSLRIQMPDRPGALSQVAAALAAHSVDIVRLDVVSHEGATVVDDLLLSAASAEDLGRAVGNFYGDVTVRTFEQVHEDPVMQMGGGLAAVAAAGSVKESWDAMVYGARSLGRGDEAVLLRATDDGGLRVLAATTWVEGIPAGEPFAAAWALHRAAPIAFAVFDSWAPRATQDSLGACWVAAMPAGNDLLIVSRRLNIAFYQGELARLAQFARASAAILAARGDTPGRRLPSLGGQEVTPAKAVTLGSLALA